MSRDADWPALPLEGWGETLATLHMWTQVVGKVRLMRAPVVNHWWSVPLYVTPRGLTTSPIPHGHRTFQVDFDLVDHRLTLSDSRGGTRSLALEPRSVADFHAEFMDRLGELGLGVEIRPLPVEVPNPVPFPSDTEHASYDPEWVDRFRRVLVQADRVLRRFRARFVGKSSPVHFFWGSFDLALTFFSGRRAPEHPGGIPHMPDWATREAYSHEVASFGFWPGHGGLGHPAFYAYAYPTPEGFAEAPVEPGAARWSTELGEFLLPWEAVRTADDPDRAVLEFCETAYTAAAERAGWDRYGLERRPEEAGRLADLLAIEGEGGSDEG